MITTTFDELATLSGTDLGSSQWLTVSQDRINTFADATEDHQWIHVDPERAKTGPFGGPIAHGYLTLSLVIPLWSELLDVDGVSTKVNYGLNKVRFPSPVRVDARIRATATLTDVQRVAGDGLQLTSGVRVDVENGDKPACIAELVFRFYR
ncbi:MaoC family dehydratase [Mycobacterium sp. AT1]|uniref:MaoC family dehydratase n=1 Tax=Mycobacterium sp. AT1 TaxID=1961706 RepID=UPI0009AE51A5|nr:MaoC family dehydratase [Mycobacterium sp. AT1]OPX13247.1 enoyl-CoA hydratase [Mycobacterium sp. AT1]